MSAVLAWEHQRDRIADAVRLLRRRHEADEYDRILAGRIAASLDALDSMLRPSAAQIAAMWAPGDEDAVEEAIELVDRQAADLYSRMGGRP